MGAIAGKVADWRSSPERGIANVTAALDRPTGRGGVRAAEGMAADKIAQNDLATIQRQTPVKASGPERFHEFANNIDDYQDKIWNEAHKPQIQRWENEPTNVQGIAAEASKSLPTEATDANPGETAKAKTWISDVLAKPRSLGQLDDFLRELNNDLRGKRSEPYGPKDVAVRNAAAKAIRNEIDNVLERNGEPGVREFNQRWGALENEKERAIEQGFNEMRKAGKAPTVPPWLHVYEFLHPGAEAIPASVGLGVSLGRMLMPTPAGKLGRGLGQLGRSSLEAPPMPPFRLSSERMPPAEQAPLPLNAGAPLTAPAREFPLLTAGGRGMPSSMEPLEESSAPPPIARTEALLPLSGPGWEPPGRIPPNRGPLPFEPPTGPEREFSPGVPPFSGPSRELPLAGPASALGERAPEVLGRIPREGLSAAAERRTGTQAARSPQAFEDFLKRQGLTRAEFSKLPTARMGELLAAFGHSGLQTLEGMWPLGQTK